jgi:hypothetical protein
MIFCVSSSAFAFLCCDDFVIFGLLVFASFVGRRTDTEANGDEKFKFAKRTPAITILLDMLYQYRYIP